MPIDYKKYPSNWRAIAFQIKNEANWICEKCNRPCKRPNESWEEFKERLTPELKAECDRNPRRFILTAAHLNHVVSDLRSCNVRPYCSVCHLRHDAKHHAQTRKNKK